MVGQKSFSENLKDVKFADAAAKKPSTKNEDGFKCIPPTLCCTQVVEPDALYKVTPNTLKIKILCRYLRAFNILRNQLSHYALGNLNS
jgi:hypothetical protein